MSNNNTSATAIIIIIVTSNHHQYSIEQGRGDKFGMGVVVLNPDSIIISLLIYLAFIPLTLTQPGGMTRTKI